MGGSWCSVILAALTITVNICCWRSNKDTRPCFWAEVLSSWGVRGQDTPCRGRLSYVTGAGLFGLAEQFSCCALAGGCLTLRAVMRSALGPTGLQNASACTLMYAPQRCPPSPAGQPPARSGIALLFVPSVWRGQSCLEKAAMVTAQQQQFTFTPCAWPLCV